MKLLDAPKNIPLNIINYTGGRGVDSKLRQLGLCPGRVVKILRYAPLGGPVMIEVGGRSVAIGRGIAAKIKVEKI
ncbi:MAG: ferrous iron transport protein A [Chloroflexi bacterium]|nr:ferrous iron transport protein A [Chloroflexota bacterium]